MQIEPLIKELNLLRDDRGYIKAGYPEYLGLFGRDSLITAWQLLDYDPEIAKNTLKILAKFQGKKYDEKIGEEPGKILHEYYPKDTPDSWFKKHKGKFEWLRKGKPVYFSLDSTPLFLDVLIKYYQKTGDFNLIKDLKRNIKRAFEWILKFDLFLNYTKKGKIKSQVWKDGKDNPYKNLRDPIYPVEVQGYAYFALENSKILGFDFSKRAEKLKKNFNKIFFIPEKNFFALALYGKRMKKCEKITSNPGHLFFTKIIDSDKIDLIVKRLFQPDLFTKYGIRTHSSLEADFDPKSYQRGSIWPHDNWIIAQGLLELGYVKEYKKIKKAILSTYNILGHSPEYYTVIDGELVKMKKACSPQAWSVSAILNFVLTKI